MSARVLVVGFDGMQATLVDGWARDGRLPTLASLGATGKELDLETTLDYLPDVIWPEFITGRVGGSIGWYRVPKQLFSGETRPRPVRVDDVDMTAVWDLASRAGRRVAAFDVPWAGPSSGTNGLHVWGWGTHDKPFGTASDPPSALASVRSHGEHAVAHDHATRSRCDDHGDDIPSYVRLLDQLRRGLETKTAAACDLLEGRSWDLFFTAFSESHCIGHHFWHFLDESSPWHDPNAPADLRNAVRSVYEQLDDALARLRAAAGRDTVTFAFASHGMGVAVGGWQLLPEVLVRLGFGSGSGAATSLRSRLPEPVKGLLRRAMPGRAREALQTAGGSLPFPLESQATRAVALENSPSGAVRLNVKGRDPFGSVEPGGEYDALCSSIVDGLLALEHPGSGEPVVAAVKRADELYGALADPSLPDLLVSFRRDVGPIESVRSPVVGTVSLPFRTPALPRSGDHTTASRLWVSGGAPERKGGRARPIDLAPTILRLLDVDPPSTLHGEALASS